MWNSFGPPAEYAVQNAALNEWCMQAGRDPGEIERTVLLDVPDEAKDLEGFIGAGAEHIIGRLRAPLRPETRAGTPARCGTARDTP